MVTPNFRAFVEELFARFGPVETRPVFGFDGLYRDEVMFGLVSDGRIFLKTDLISRKTFEMEGAEPLHYHARDGAEIAMSYYQLPARLYDEPDEAAAWARTAYEVALRSPTVKRRQRRRMKESRARR